MMLYLFPLIEDHVFQQGPVLQPFDLARTNKVWTKTLTFLAWRGPQISRAVLPRTAGFMQGISGSVKDPWKRRWRILGFSQVTHSCSRFFQNMEDHGTSSLWVSTRLRTNMKTRAVVKSSSSPQTEWWLWLRNRTKKTDSTEARRVLGHSFE